MCSGFHPPQAALAAVASGEKELWVVWCNSGEVRVKEQGKEIRIDDWGKLVPSSHKRGELRFAVI